MSRSFIDQAGVQWEVRAIEPQLAERRSAARRRSALPPPGLERRRAADRRRAAEVRTRVTPGYERGWLLFRSEGDRRRLAPIPQAWQRLSDESLAQLCAQARPAPVLWGRSAE
jgi:hypothetical protein